MMEPELNLRIAAILGYFQIGDAWCNTWGAPISELPDFSGKPQHAQIVRRHYESLQSQIEGTNAAFFAEYREDMTPEEICYLAIRVSSQSEDE